MHKIAAELSNRMYADQAMRTNETPWDPQIDYRNTEYLKQLTAEHGWPLISAVGQQAATAAWLIAQHADHDPAFQAACLTKMQSLPEDEVDVRNIAYLEDRVRVNTGRRQLYGTQFSDQNGLFGPQPIEDAEQLDVRRAAVGLAPFAEYEKQMQELNNRKDTP